MVNFPTIFTIKYTQDGFGINFNKHIKKYCNFAANY